MLTSDIKHDVNTQVMSLICKCKERWMAFRRNLLCVEISDKKKNSKQATMFSMCRQDINSKKSLVSIGSAEFVENWVKPRFDKIRWHSGRGSSVCLEADDRWYLFIYTLRSEHLTGIRTFAVNSNISVKSCPSIRKKWCHERGFIYSVDACLIRPNF